MVRSPSSPTPGYSLVEIVGEFLDAETDRGLHAYFRRHYGEYFLALARIHRTTFARQAANLWAIKEALWRNLLSQIRFDPALSLVDSFPLPVCRFARVCRCRCLAGESAFSYDEAAKLTFTVSGHTCASAGRK